MDNPTMSAVAVAPGVYKDRVDEWVHTLSAAELWSQLSRVSIWFKLAAFAAFIASSFFVVGYFAGSLQVSSWDAEQWLHGIILGVPFTATLTMFQFFLYSNGNKQAGWSSLLSFAVAAGFGVMTEIGQGMERQENRVHQRSLESPVLQSALKAIENSTTAPVGNRVSTQAVEKLAYHQYELARCNRHLEKKGQRRVDKCINYEQKRISRYQAIVDSQTQHQQRELSAQAGKTAQLLQTAKQLERDEKHYHAFIRFLHNLLGFETYLSANFILSLLLVMAFEYAFHYLGNFERDTKAALRVRGYEVKRFRHKPPKQQREERAPVQRTLQNQYMPLQQVGFDPLLVSAANAPAITSGAASALQQERKTTAKPNANTAAGKAQKNASGAPPIPSSFSTYLGKALSTGTANTPQEVQQFLQSARTASPQKSVNNSAENRVSQPLEKVNESLSQEHLGCTSTVSGSTKSESGHREKVTLKPVGGAGKSVLKSETGTVKSESENVESVGNDRTRTPPKCNSALPRKVKSTAGQGTLSAELQSLADQLYVLWKQQILREQIKPTFRPGKALLNQYLCQNKRRQTPTPLELDNITQQWFTRGLKEKVILANQQQGRGHARYVVNPALIIAA